MASNNSIRRAFLRLGRLTKLHSDRLLYVFPVLSLGGCFISCLRELAATGWLLTSANEVSGP